jgi:Flp pilus assembly protein TadG
MRTTSPGARALLRATRWTAGPRHDVGQGLVELALALPVLLLILLGIADIGRAFYYTVVVSDAAREAAAYAVANPTATGTAVAQHGCNATGLVTFGSSCPAALVVTCLTTCPTNGADSNVRVTYSFDLISGSLVNRVVPMNPIVLRAESHFPGAQP